MFVPHIHAFGRPLSFFSEHVVGIHISIHFILTVHLTAGLTIIFGLQTAKIHTCKLLKMFVSGAFMDFDSSCDADHLQVLLSQNLALACFPSLAHNEGPIMGQIREIPTPHSVRILVRGQAVAE